MTCSLRHPPLEAKNALCALATTGAKNRSKPQNLRVVDVQRAYFFAPAKRAVYVQLPPEDWGPGTCGRLGKSMHGTRDAANKREEHYSEKLALHGFKQGRSSPCLLYNEELDLRLAVHGDELTFLGTDDALNWVHTTMGQLFDIKIRGRLGPQTHDDNAFRLLNRIITWDATEIQREADQRNADSLIRELSLSGTQGVVPPGIQNKNVDDNDGPGSQHRLRTTGNVWHERISFPSKGPMCTLPLRNGLGTGPSQSKAHGPTSCDWERRCWANPERPYSFTIRNTAHA